MSEFRDFWARVGLVLLLSVGALMFGLVVVVVIFATLPLLPLLLIYEGGEYVVRKITNKHKKI